MPSFYSIIRYVPDPVADECVNVGVVTYSGSEVRLHFAESWARARQLAGRDPKTLREVVADISGQYTQGLLSETAIRKYADSWHGQIQWTAPRPSLKSVDELLEEISEAYLPYFEASSTKRPGKRRAIRLAIENLTSDLRSKYQAPKHKVRSLIKTEYSMTGRLEQHELDLAIVNGALKAAAFAVSLSVVNSQLRKRDIDAIAFAVEDVRRVHKRIPLSVLAYTGDAMPGEVRKVSGLFRELDAELIPDSRIPTWSRSIVDALPEDILES